jgi:tRNA/rRNA methyltransferase
MKPRIILLNPQEDGNIGSVARAMKNFGFSELYIVSPLCEMGKDARRLASHGLSVLEGARIVQSFEEAVEGCDLIVGTTGKKGGQKTPKRKALEPGQLCQSIGNAKAAIVFGNEAYGIPNKLLARMDFAVRIPTNPDYPILNLAQSVVIILYELSRKEFVKTVREKPISRQVRTQLEKYTHEIAGRVYEQPHQQRFIESTLARIYGKAALSKQEGGRLISFYRKIMDGLADK